MYAFGGQGSAVELRIRPVARGPPTPGRKAVRISHPQESDTIKATRNWAEAVIVNRNITVRISVIYIIQCAIYACMYKVPGPFLGPFFLADPQTFRSRVQGYLAAEWIS